MKVWYGYGSEHSANLVLIGRFSNGETAARVQILIDTISQIASDDYADGTVDHWSLNEKVSERTEKRLRELNIYNISPSDIADFGLLQPRVEMKGSELRIRTDETEIGGLVKFMVSNGARVEVFSADRHSEPNF